MEEVEKWLLHFSTHDIIPLILNSSEPIAFVGPRLLFYYLMKQCRICGDDDIYLPPNKEEALFSTELLGIVLAKNSPWKKPINKV